MNVLDCDCPYLEYLLEFCVAGFDHTAVTLPLNQNDRIGRNQGKLER